jgi:5-methylcytosine-specific restriction endonuclease McrA
MYCSDRITEENRSFDHIDPVSRGGEHSLANLVVCCQACNSGKRDKPLLVWLACRRAA